MIILQERSGIIHVIEYCSGRYLLSLCSRSFPKDHTLNTFATDSPIINICPQCTMIYKNIHDDDLNSLIRTFKSSLPNNLISNYNYIQNGFSAIYNKYWFLEERYSEKTLRYQRKVKRKNNQHSKKGR